MKTFNKIFALFLLQGCFLNSFAQVSLDHTFNAFTTSLVGFENVNEPIDYFCIVTNDHQICMYNPNYILYKTIDVNLPQGYSLSSISSAGKHIINNDDKIEFFVSANNNQIGNTYYTAMIINEDGQIINNLGYNYMTFCMGFINVNDQIKMILMKYHQNNNSTITYSYSVYSCYGNYSPNNAIQSFSNLVSKPYPNPAVNTINLPYKLEPGNTSVIKIYNMNGQMIDSFKIGCDFEAITIDVSHYAKGVYTYEYNGISNKFIVQ